MLNSNTSPPPPPQLFRIYATFLLLEKRTLQLSSPNNLNNSGGETRQNPNASSVTIMEPINAIAETDSMISRVRKGSYPVRR